MLRVLRRSRSFALSLLMLGVAAPACYAHFAWLATDEQGRVLLFFGESPSDRDYKLPEAVAGVRVLECSNAAKPAELKLEKVEEDGFIGRRSVTPAPKGAPLEAAVRYGVYHGMLLDYYVKSLTTVAAADWEKSTKSETLKLNPTPRLAGGGLELVVRYEGKRLAGAAATIIDAEGSQTEAETDADGVAKFEAPPEGLVGFLVNRMDDKATGKIDDQEYTSAGQYATVTIMYKKPAPTGAPAATAVSAALPSLPEPLSSFGGAVCDGYLYVYGGHIGTEHDHSKDNLSTHFRRVKLDGGGVGRVAHANAASRPSAVGPRRQALSRRRAQRPQRTRGERGPALRRRVCVLRPRRRYVDRHAAAP